MNTLRLIPAYLGWHYTKAFSDMFRIYGDTFWFLWRFYSVPTTLKTFFSPWERMGEQYQKGLDFGAIASTFIINTLMRILGMIMRIFLLALTLISFIIALFAMIVVLIVWICAPVLLVILLVLGIKSLLN